MRRITKVAQATRSYDQRLELDALGQSWIEMRAIKQTITVVVWILWGVVFYLSRDCDRYV